MQRVSVICGAKAANELGLGSVGHPVEHVDLEVTLDAEQRREQADGTGAGHGGDARVEERPGADAIDLLPRLRDDGRGFEEYADLRRALKDREADLSRQGAAQRKDEQLKAAFAQARAAMETALGPILQQLVKERGANMVLDKQAVVFATASGFDITGEAINRLNQKLPSFKINLNAPPPGPKK